MSKVQSMAATRHIAETQGLNGEVLLSKTHVTVGRVDGAGYGYKRTLRVTVDARMERLTRKAEYETVTHGTVASPVMLAISASVWRPDGRDSVQCGQCPEVLGELVSYAAGWDAGKVHVLSVIWECWHLNDMRASCVHQSASGDLRVCSVTGYKWGSKWLVEPLPAGTIEDVRRLFGLVMPSPR